VTRAARIEPITPPGSVYASEAFAATLAASGRQDCALEYVGEVSLAKG
jgi:class 3 adenylate cyclase